MVECPVCWHETSEFVKPCGHPLCMSCASIWLLRTPRCPVCRTIVVLLSQPVETTRGIVMHFATREHIGITLRDHAYGVLVTRLVHRDAAARSGVRRGDVITHLNGIRVRSHANAALILEHARNVGCDVCCTVLSTHTQCSIFGFVLHKYWR